MGGQAVLPLSMQMGENGEATHLEVFLTRYDAGDYQVCDFYNYALGETVSGFMSRLFVKGIAAESKSPLEALFKAKNTTAKGWDNPQGRSPFRHPLCCALLTGLNRSARRLRLVEVENPLRQNSSHLRDTTLDPYRRVRVGSGWNFACAGSGVDELDIAIANDAACKSQFPFHLHGLAVDERWRSIREQFIKVGYDLVVCWIQVDQWRLAIALWI